jgi:hypothetical protein
MRGMNCETDTCIIHIKDLFSFEWDTVFIFYSPVEYDVCKYQEYRRYQRGNRRIAFVKNSEMIYHEDELAIEVPYSFYIMSDDIFYTPETAVFYVTWDLSHRYYNLIPVFDGKREIINKQ